MNARHASPAEIRTFLQHGEGSRRVRVHRDGRVTYFGSPSSYEDGHEYWHDGRYSEEYLVIDGEVTHR